MSIWTFQGSEIEYLPECIGFVYIITNTISGRMYVGKKLKHFSKTSIKTVTLKSGEKKKKKKKTQVESDWKSYFGSCVELQNDVKLLGEENFTREILHFCNSKGFLSYMEAKEQFIREVLLSPKYYNGIISCRINKSHIKGIYRYQD